MTMMPIMAREGSCNMVNCHFQYIDASDVIASRLMYALVQAAGVWYTLYGILQQWYNGTLCMVFVNDNHLHQWAWCNHAYNHALGNCGLIAV